MLRAHLDGTPPGVHTYLLARWSLVSRLVRDARETGADQVTDLGSLPLGMSHPGALVRIGTRSGGQWVSVTPGMEAIAQAVTDMEAGLSLGLRWSVMGLVLSRAPSGGLGGTAGSRPAAPAALAPAQPSAGTARR